MITAEDFLVEVNRGRQGLNQGYSTGMDKLDEVTDGITKSMQTVLFASSGVGKSAYVLYSHVYKPVSEHLYDDRLHIDLFSLEMEENAVLAKILSIYIKEKYGVSLSLKKIFSRKKGFILDDTNYGYVEASMPWLMDFQKVVTIHTQSMTANYFYEEVMSRLNLEGEFKEEGKKKKYYPNNPDKVILFITDHLNLAVPSKGRKKKEEIDLISNMAVGIRNRTAASFLFIMQSNRNVASMDRKKQGYNEPIKEDVKDSNVPVEDAVTLLAIYNPTVDHLATYRDYDIKQMGYTFRSILCLKSRYGDSGVADCCHYDGDTDTWTELPKANEINDYSIYNHSRLDNNIKADCDEDIKDNNKRKLNFKM